MIRAFNRLALQLIVAALPAAAGAQVAAPTRPAVDISGVLAVFAAASLTDAFRALAGDFGRAHPHVEVRLNLAGSQTLVQQIREGAAGDVFASADEEHMRELAEGGALAGGSRLFAANRLEIAVQPGNPGHISGLADLAAGGRTVVLGGPTVPVGRYTAEAFARAGLPLPQASQETDVKAVLTKVALGEADAGVVYATDIHAAGERVQGIEIPPGHDVVAHYPIAVLKEAPHPMLAQRFIEFVLSEKGRQVLARYGFLPP